MVEAFGHVCVCTQSVLTHKCPSLVLACLWRGEGGSYLSVRRVVLLSSFGPHLQSSLPCEPRHKKQWLLICVPTREVVVLAMPASPEWFLGFEDDGFGFVVDGDKVLRCEEVLTLQRCKREGGEVESVLTPDGSVIALVDYLSKALTLSGSLRVGDVAAWCDVDMMLYSTGQSPTGDKLWFSMYSILGLLDLTVGKHKSKYLHTMWRNWSKFLESLGMYGGLRKMGLPVNSRNDQEADEGASAGFPSISTTALVALLSKWAWTTSKKHGALTKSHRS